jgi:molecular chaperone DnaK (HSP70)
VSLGTISKVVSYVADKTGQAAKAAGLDPVTMIKEPEAAALFTAQALDFALKTDDAFVICDAGGGTVDLISYQVERVNPTLQVKELVPGTGKKSNNPLFRR